MSPEHTDTLRRNQERAIKILYLAKQNTAPDPARIAAESMRIVDERQADTESNPLWGFVTVMLLVSGVALLLYGLVG
jgi:hypothetical protein